MSRLKVRHRKLVVCRVIFLETLVSSCDSFAKIKICFQKYNSIGVIRRQDGIVNWYAVTATYNIGPILVETMFTTLAYIPN